MTTAETTTMPGNWPSKPLDQLTKFIVATIQTKANKSAQIQIVLNLPRIKMGICGWDKLMTAPGEKGLET